MYNRRLHSIIVVLALHVLAQVDDKIGDPTHVANSMSLDLPPTTSEQDTHCVTMAQHSSLDTSSHSTPSAPIPDKNDRGFILPIEGISPYQSKWVIKARVTQKSDIRGWSNFRGEGKLFSITLMDDSGLIKAIAFNLAAEELHSRIYEGKVYYISKARVNLAKRQFSHLVNPYELALDVHTEFEEVSCLCLQQSDLL